MEPSLKELTEPLLVNSSHKTWPSINRNRKRSGFYFIIIFIPVPCPSIHRTEPDQVSAYPKDETRHETSLFRTPTGTCLSVIVTQLAEESELDQNSAQRDNSRFLQPVRCAITPRTRRELKNFADYFLVYDRLYWLVSWSGQCYKVHTPIQADLVVVVVGNPIKYCRYWNRFMF